MIYFLDDQHKDWAAHELLCRRIGIPYSRTREKGMASTLRAALLSHVIRKPQYLIRLLSFLNVYWDCKLQSHILQKEAGKIRNKHNRMIVEHILRQAGHCMVSEPQGAWPEIIGLFSQKLAHVGYYDDARADADQPNLLE